MNEFLTAAWITAAVSIAITLALTVGPRLGAPGRAFADVCTRAPMLDLIVAMLSWIPWVAAGVLAGWPAAGGALVGEIAALYVWIIVHELAHPNARSGPRIVSFLNIRVGWFRNHAALWVTSIAYPVFWAIRLAQYFAYPMLVVLVRFPSYRGRDWVNVSRQKFEGLVGHDLIWCLYCDWMTGVYSLGAEMLRNVESFWCPIRFYDGKKCENCRIDFPDIDGGWVPADGTMADVERVMEKQYPPGATNSWFGHPARLTVNGEEPVS